MLYDDRQSVYTEHVVDGETYYWVCFYNGSYLSKVKAFGLKNSHNTSSIYTDDVLWNRNLCDNELQSKYKSCTTYNNVHLYCGGFMPIKGSYLSLYKAFSLQNEHSTSSIY